MEISVPRRRQGWGHHRFSLHAHRDKAAARRYFEKSIDQNGLPETVTIDGSSANLAALEAINAELETPIKVRQTKYLNNIVEQDRRAIKRRIRPMLGFKDFGSARIILSGIEVMHMISQGQMKYASKNQAICSPAVLFASYLSNPYHIALFHLNRLTATKPSR